jgi:hypothetical protein
MRQNGEQQQSDETRLARAEGGNRGRCGELKRPRRYEREPIARNLLQGEVQVAECDARKAQHARPRQGAIAQVRDSLAGKELL